MCKSDGIAVFARVGQTDSYKVLEAGVHGGGKLLHICPVLA